MPKTPDEFLMAINAAVSDAANHAALLNQALDRAADAAFHLGPSLAGVDCLKALSLCLATRAAVFEIANRLRADFP